MSYYQTHHQVFSFNNYFLNTYYVPEVAADVWEQNKAPVLLELTQQKRETNHKQELRAPTAGGMGSNLGQGARIPHAVQFG